MDEVLRRCELPFVETRVVLRARARRAEDGDDSKHKRIGIRTGGVRFEPVPGLAGRKTPTVDKQRVKTRHVGGTDQLGTESVRSARHHVRGRMRRGVAHREAIDETKYGGRFGHRGNQSGSNSNVETDFFATREISRGDESGGKIREIYPFTLV